jgi:hypothetical protein
MKTKLKIPALAIVLFALAVLLLAYSIWAIVNVHGYISEAIAAGQASLGEDLFDIVSVYMSGAAMYILFAVLFGVIGFKMVKTVEYEEEIEVEVFEIGNGDDENVSDDDFFNLSETDSETQESPKNQESLKTPEALEDEDSEVFDKDLDADKDKD